LQSSNYDPFLQQDSLLSINYHISLLQEALNVQDIMAYHWLHLCCETWIFVTIYQLRKMCQHRQSLVPERWLL